MKMICFRFWKAEKVKFLAETYSPLQVLNFQVVVLNPSCTEESLAETFKTGRQGPRTQPRPEKSERGVPG